MKSHLRTYQTFDCHYRHQMNCLIVAIIVCKIVSSFCIHLQQNVLYCGRSLFFPKNYSTTSEALMAGTIIITIVKTKKPCAQFSPNKYTQKKNRNFFRHINKFEGKRKIRKAEEKTWKKPSRLVV